MPRVALKHSAPMETRNAYTKVDCEITVTVDGKELPSMSVIGEALEEVVELFSNKVKESYKVPPRVNTPVAQPYAAKQT